MLLSDPLRTHVDACKRRKERRQKIHSDDRPENVPLITTRIDLGADRPMKGFELTPMHMGSQVMSRMIAIVKKKEVHHASEKISRMVKF
jgi:hypothetical protein